MGQRARTACDRTGCVALPHRRLREGRAACCDNHDEARQPAPCWRAGGSRMKFLAVVEQVLALLQRQQRISYRALKREFDLDDEYVEDLKTELIKARRL